jgi:hypothetical protein
MIRHNLRVEKKNPFVISFSRKTTFKKYCRE